MAYRNCKFCYGRGCLACEQEREKGMKAAIEPIFVADLNSASDMELLNNAIGAKAIERIVLSTDGDPARVVQELDYNLAIASFIQFTRKRATTGEDDQGHE